MHPYSLKITGDCKAESEKILEKIKKGVLLEGQIQRDQLNQLNNKQVTKTQIENEEVNTMGFQESAIFTYVKEKYQNKSPQD